MRQRFGESHAVAFKRRSQHEDIRCVIGCRQRRRIGFAMQGNPVAKTPRFYGLADCRRHGRVAIRRTEAVEPPVQSGAIGEGGNQP